MSYIIVWGYKTGLSNKKFLGIQPCSNCGKFAQRYLAKSFFRINLFWFIPIFGVPTGKYLRCANCDGVRKLTRAEWKELKEAARYMPKKKNYLKAYEELKALVIAASADELTTDVIYNRLLGKLDFTDDGGHIRELVDVYLKNSQNAAAIAAKANGEAVAEIDSPVEGTVPELAAENGTAEEAPAAPAVAAAAPVGIGSAEEPKKESKKRLLWLIPAILLLPVALFMLVVGGVLIADNSMDIIDRIISVLIATVIPVGLDILFFVLAFKKKK